MRIRTVALGHIRGDRRSVRRPWTCAACAGLGAVSYAYIAAVGLGARHGLWLHAIIPALLTVAFAGLLAARDGRLRPTAIRDQESLLIITYGILLALTAQITWLSPSRWSWSLLAAAPPAAVCIYAAWLHRKSLPSSR